MTATMRNYRGLEDFIRVGDFLTETYQSERNSNWLQARWEYMHWHPALDLFSLRHIGIWEDEGRVVAVVHYEDRPGDAYFQVRPGHEHLKLSMLLHAENRLSRCLDSGQRRLRLFVSKFDKGLQTLAEERGYRCLSERPQWTSTYSASKELPRPALPAGFRLQSLADENDLQKLDRCLWRGFNHAGEPDGDLAGRKLMQAAPNWRPELNVVVVAPNGAYVSYSGIWYDQINQVGYVEPVATDPDFRRLGLGKAAVLECVRRCTELGATIIQVGSGQAFYEAIGFRRAWSDYIWEKTF